MIEANWEPDGHRPLRPGDYYGKAWPSQQPTISTPRMYWLVLRYWFGPPLLAALLLVALGVAGTILCLR